MVNKSAEGRSLSCASLADSELMRITAAGNVGNPVGNQIFDSLEFNNLEVAPPPPSQLITPKAFRPRAQACARQRASLGTISSGFAAVKRSELF
jgi:hypothetical protein